MCTSLLINLREGKRRGERRGALSLSIISGENGGGGGRSGTKATTNTKWPRRFLNAFVERSYLSCPSPSDAVKERKVVVGTTHGVNLIVLHL